MKVEHSVANTHAQVFDHQLPQVQPLWHDPGHRTKILVYMLYVFYL